MSRTDSFKFFSNDPLFAGKPGTPAPVICEFCGAERYTEGFKLLGNIMWCPFGAVPCTCSEGIAAFEREQAEIEAKKQAVQKAEKDRKMRERVRKIIGESEMGARSLQRMFETFITETPEQEKIKKAAQNYAKNFNIAAKGRNGFIISGTKGTGKTHIAAAIANDLLRRGTAVICMTERNLFDKIRRTYGGNNGAEFEIRRVYETVPLLIIDDIGKEKASEWTIATLYAIIDGRYEKNKPIIITTNYGVQSLIDRITPKGDDKTTAEAIIDRLNEMCKSIVMSGESWRSR